MKWFFNSQNHRRMKRILFSPFWQCKILWISLSCIFLLNSCRTTETIVEIILAGTFYERLAERWAPIHYQDVDVTGSHSLSGRSDYIMAIDYDNDWKTINNWEHLEDHYHRKDKAVCYYSICQTSTHWFLIYAFYHPRDWCDYFDLGLDTHENDLEGLLMVVKRPAEYDAYDFGDLLGIITVYHHDFFSYIAPGSPLESNHEDIDGTLEMASFDGQINEGALHPKTAQQSKGHGLKAYPQVSIEGGDGIIYYPSLDHSEKPSGPNDRDVKYELIDIFEEDGLWDHRNDSDTFHSWGIFKGDDGQNNSAKAPWKWDDRNDGSDLQGGELANDPAKITNIYFSNLGDFSRAYELNKYQNN